MTSSDGPVSRSPQGPVASSAAAAKGAILAGLAVALGYALLRSSPQWAPGAFADDGVYLAVGKSLADGEGYRSLHAAGAPIHAKYPPGLPWVYGVFWTLGGTLAKVHAWATGLSLLASAAAAGVMWFIGRRTLGASPLWLALGMIGPFFLEGAVQYMNLPLSEPLFMLLVVLGCAAFSGAVRGEVLGVLAVAACLSAAVLIRTQGLVLLVAVGLAYPWTRARWKHGLTMIGAPLLTALLWNRRLAYWRQVDSASLEAAVPEAAVPEAAVLEPALLEPDELGYTAVLLDSGPGAVLTSAFQTIRATSTGYLESVSAHLASASWIGVGLLLALALVAGIGALRVRTRTPLLFWSAVTLTGVLFVWPYSQDRFLLTLLPLWGLLAVGDAPPVRRLTKSRSGRVVVACVTAVVLLIGSRQVQVRRSVGASVSEATPYGHPAWFLAENTRYLTSTAAWLNAHASPADRVLAPLSAGVFLLSGLQATNATPFEAIGRPLFAVEGRYLAERIRDQRVSLLVLWGSTYPITRDAAALQRDCPEALEFAGTTAAPTQAAVFRIHDRDACLGDWINRVAGEPSA